MIMVFANMSRSIVEAFRRGCDKVRADLQVHGGLLRAGWFGQATRSFLHGSGAVETAQRRSGPVPSLRLGPPIPQLRSLPRLGRLPSAAQTRQRNVHHFIHSHSSFNHHSIIIRSSILNVPNTFVFWQYFNNYNWSSSIDSDSIKIIFFFYLSDQLMLTVTNELDCIEGYLYPVAHSTAQFTWKEWNVACKPGIPTNNRPAVDILAPFNNINRCHRNENNSPDTKYVSPRGLP